MSDHYEPELDPRVNPEPAAPAPVTLVDLMALGIARADGHAVEDLAAFGDAKHYIDLAEAALEAGRPPERPIILDTDNGQAALIRVPPALADPPRCDACPDDGPANLAGVAVRLRLANFADADADLLHVCGSCFARGLAYSLARGRGLTVPRTGRPAHGGYPDGGIPDRHAEDDPPADPQCPAFLELAADDVVRCTLEAGHASPHSYA